MTAAELSDDPQRALDGLAEQLREIARWAQETLGEIERNAGRDE